MGTVILIQSLNVIILITYICFNYNNEKEAKWNIEYRPLSNRYYLQYKGDYIRWSGLNVDYVSCSNVGYGLYFHSVAEAQKEIEKIKDYWKMNKSRIIRI